MKWSVSLYFQFEETSYVQPSMSFAPLPYSNRLQPPSRR